MKYSLTLSILATETVFVIVLLMFIYFNYKRISELEKDNEQIKYYQNKNEVNDNLSFEVNKNIIDYINSLKIIKGSELDAVQKNVLNEINKLKKLHHKEIKQVSKNIKDNKDKIKINKIKISTNKDNISDNLNRIYRLRTAVKYDLDKLLIRFIKEFLKKYDVTTNNQTLLYDTKLFGSFLDYSPVLLLFDNGLDKPDKILFDNTERIFPLLHKLLNNYQIQNYTNKIIFETNYLKLKDTSSNYIYHKGLKELMINVPLHAKINSIIQDDTKEVINWFSNNIPFLFDIYLPRLLNYIDINKIFIFNKIDEMMVNYFSTFPSFEYFNEFFTHITLSDIQNDRNHLLNILRRYIFEDVNKNKENEIINNEHLYKILIVLLPEMLFMMKYNIDYANKYQKLIVSEYFINIPTLDSRVDQKFNLVNFVNFIKYFTCKSVAHNGNTQTYEASKEKENYRNIALKLYLSENMAYVNTSTRYHFENTFLNNVNDAILSRSDIITADSKFDYEEFVCNPYNNTCVDEECDEDISTQPITPSEDQPVE